MTGRTHSLADLSQDTSGMWWWACECGATCDDATLSAMESAQGYLDHLTTAPARTTSSEDPR